MNILDIIVKKREKRELSREEIDFFIKGYSNGEIEDYQASSLLMAICINGMSDEETFNLTNSMINSGKIIDFSSVSNMVVDKHSTGGVGDKTSLVLVPLLASVGLSVAKMSGRGLGHTGGTIDKLESIKGYKTNISIEEYKKQIKEIGCGIISQSSDIVLADKKIYSLRDVSGTVESIPLIASSIMSKKIATGANLICLDVKVGNGAFFKNYKDAIKAAKLMIKIGKKFNKKVCAILSSMDQPLGYAIGNKLEVLEAIDTLKNNGPDDLLNTCYNLASVVMEKSKLLEGKRVKEILEESIKNNNAYNKFVEMIKYQGGTIDDLKIKYESFKMNSPYIGYISHIDTYLIGKLVSLLGGGRSKKDDIIDLDVGIIIKNKIGDYIDNSTILFEVHSKEEINEEIKMQLLNSIQVRKRKTKKIKEVLKIMK